MAASCFLMTRPVLTNLRLFGIRNGLNRWEACAKASGSARAERCAF